MIHLSEIQSNCFQDDQAKQDTTNSGFSGDHYLSYHTSFELAMKALVVKAVPKLNRTLQYNSFGFTFAGSVRLVENNNETIYQAQEINKSDYTSTNLE